MRVLISFACAWLCACTPHEDVHEPQPLPVPNREPAVVVEPEPAPALPAVIAPALPPLAPTRPLAHLDVLWSDIAYEGTTPDHAWSVGTTVLDIMLAEAEALGTATAEPVVVAALEPSWRWKWQRAGSLLLAISGDQFMAFDHATGRELWSVKPSPDGASYMQFVSPRALVASVYRSGVDMIGAWALEDGRELWTRQGGEGAGFARVSKLWSDGERGYFISDAGLEVFEPATGTTLWSFALREPDCGVATGEGVVVVEDPGGHVILDAALGGLRARVPGSAARCSWADYATDTGVAPGVIAGGRLYAFDSAPPQHRASLLRAYDLADGRELWHATGFDDDTLLVDHDAVLVSRDEQVLLALEADSGTIAAELIMGSPFWLELEPVGGAAGPLVLVHDDEGGHLLLGRRETAPVIEDFEIRGRIVSDGYIDKRRLAGVQLVVGGQQRKTDARGRFVVRGRGRGIISVAPPEQPNYDENWMAIGFDRRRVVLNGSKTYDLGELEAYEMSMEWRCRWSERSHDAAHSPVPSYLRVSAPNPTRGARIDPSASASPSGSR